VDRSLGKLLALLERLKLDRRTIVIFQSDHGYNIGHHGIHTRLFHIRSLRSRELKLR